MDEARRPGDLRVLHVVDSGERRGAEVFTADLVGALDRRNVQQHVAVLMGAPPFAVGYRAPSTPLGAKGGGIPGLHIDPRAVARLRRLIRAWGPSIVQTHGGATLKYGTLAGRRNVPIAARVIGTSAAWATHGPRRVAHSRLLKRATNVAAVADAVNAELVGTFGVPSDRVQTIPNGVDVERIAARLSRGATRSALGIDQHAEVLISICALTWEKDPLTHLEVSERLRRDRPDAIHLIVGDGPMRPDVDRRIDELGSAGSVRVLGNRDDVGDLLSVSDVLLFASRSDGMEGMPAAVIEAGLAGLPVAGYAVAGVGEVVEHDQTGLLVSPGDVEGLSAAVRTLMDSPATREQMGAKARDRCLARFTIDTVSEEYLAMYRTILGLEIESRQP